MSKNIDNLNVSIRILTQGKEVGCIIGKKGETVKRFRNEMGVNVSISSDIGTDRIVTVTGDVHSVLKVIDVIGRALEQWYCMTGRGRSDNVKAPVTMRLLIPSCQCGSIIGKGGSRIKEIREISNASVQLCPEMMPASTERLATISGSLESLLNAVTLIIETLSETPLKGNHILYKPMPLYNSMKFSEGPSRYIESTPIRYPDTPNGYSDNLMNHLDNQAMSSSSSMQLLHEHKICNGLTKSDLDAIITSHIKPRPKTQEKELKTEMPESEVKKIELNVPHDLVGCIIGRGGSKIAEIRHASGANVEVSRPKQNHLDNDRPMERIVTITGTPNEVKVAHYLVKMSLEYQKAVLEGKNININELSRSEDFPLSDISQTSSVKSVNSRNTMKSNILTQHAPNEITTSLNNILPLAQIFEQPNVLSYLKGITALSEVISNINKDTTNPTISSNDVFAIKQESNSNNGPKTDSVRHLRFPNERNRYTPY